MLNEFDTCAVCGIEYTPGDEGSYGYSNKKGAVHYQECVCSECQGKEGLMTCSNCMGLFPTKLLDSKYLCPECSLKAWGGDEPMSASFGRIIGELEAWQAMHKAKVDPKTMSAINTAKSKLLTLLGNLEAFEVQEKMRKEA